jgi:hypothetical protein
MFILGTTKKKKNKANKNLTNIKIIVVAQVVEHLPSHAKT